MAVALTNPCLYYYFLTKLLEDMDYASLFLSNFPIKMPEPKAARWNARLKAKMVEEKDQIKWGGWGEEQCAGNSLLCREFAARSTRETSESRPSPGATQFCLLFSQSFMRNIFALFWVIYPALERCKMN